jgi:serine/threonine-protein kinase
VTPAVPGYEPLRRLSSGAARATEVWQARDAAGRIVALKLLAPPAEAVDVHRFENEARLLARVGGRQHVIALHQRLASPPALVLAWMERGSLRERIHPGGFEAPPNPLAVHAAIRLGSELSDALVWLHANGVFHRDVKPANVLLDSGGTAGLADLSVAASGEPPRSLPDAWIEEETGTLGYAAPELLRDPAHAGASLDIYGVGVTLYEALTGRLPHDFRPSETERQLRWRLARGEPPVPLAERGWAGPASLAAVVARCLEPEPGNRFPDAESLRDALSTVAHGGPQSTRS